MVELGRNRWWWETWHTSLLDGAGVGNQWRVRERLRGVKGDHVKLTWGRVVGVVFLLAVAGCGTGGADDGQSDLSNGTDTTVTAVSTVVAGGPCFSDNNTPVGTSGVTIRSGDQSITASLGYETINYCPGHPQHGSVGLSADGFFYSLESTAVDVDPGEPFTLVAPGYPGATLHAGWSNEGATALPPVELSLVDTTTWEVTAPEEVGVYRLDMRLAWVEGEATYAVLITTDGTANTRTTTSSPPRPGISTDEAPLEEALAPELIFDNSDYEAVEFAGGAAHQGVVRGTDAVVFVCNGIQITAHDAIPPGLDSLLEQVADQVLAWQECVPQLP